MRKITVVILVLLASGCFDPYSAPPALLELDSCREGAQARYPIGAGDMDGDGHADIAAIEPGARWGSLAVVYSGESGQIIRRFEVEEGECLVGTHDSCAPSTYREVAPAGDVDRDGAPDLIVADEGFCDGTGIVWVFSGRTGSILWRWNGDASGDRFGSAVAAGHIDQDGCSDIIVGADGLTSDRDAPDGSGYTRRPGYVRLFSGSTGEPLGSIEERPALTGFGWLVRAIGDLDSDGSTEFAVGSSPLDSPEVIRVYRGADLSVMYSFGDDQDQDGTASSICGTPGWNGDGTPDFAIGREEEIHVLSGIDGSRLATVRAPTHPEVCSVGDFNGDGHPDLLYRQWVSESGVVLDTTIYARVKIASGRNGRSLFGVAFHSPFVRAEAAGDVDGDGLGDIVIESNDIRIYSWSAMR